jgi:hypothetical protein
MITKKIIDITTIVGLELKSRMAVKAVFNSVEELDAMVVLLDFKNVKFATRSFIDEFYITFLKDSSNSKIELLNVSSEVYSLFEAVKSTQNKGKNVNLIGSVKHFHSVSQINRYLSSLAF